MAVGVQLGDNSNICAPAQLSEKRHSAEINASRPLVLCKMRPEQERGVRVGLPWRELKLKEPVIGHEKWFAAAAAAAEPEAGQARWRVSLDQFRLA